MAAKKSHEIAKISVKRKVIQARDGRYQWLTAFIPSIGSAKQR